MSYLLAFLGFAALIILHEAGHFAAAKAVGMRVERFSLFFGPMLWKVRRGETEYGIGPIPLGGYVKITGMNPHEEYPAGGRAARLLQPAGVEADRRDPGRPGGQPADRVRDRVGPVPVKRRRSWLQAGRRGDQGHAGRHGAASPGDKLVSVDGVTGSARRAARPARDPPVRRRAGQRLPRDDAGEDRRAIATGQLITFELRPRYSAADHRPLLGFEFGSAQQSVGPVHAASLTVSGLWSVTTQTVSVVAKIFEPQERKQLNSVVGGYTITQQSFATSTTLAL